MEPPNSVAAAALVQEMTMDVLASGGLIDWEQLTGQSKFVVDIVSVPIFSAIAGVLTNWTGILMMFAPTHFTGFYVPGVKTLFPFLPRKVQVLPVWAPGGIVGFQGFIPSRAEKMAAICVDKAISRIGNVKDFFHELDPDGIAAYVAQIAVADLRTIVTDVMEKEHPRLWRELTPEMREVLIQTIEAEMPAIVQRAFQKIGDQVDQLVDVTLLTVGFLRQNPEILRDIVQAAAAPELKFMVRIGLLGFPFGLVLALWVSMLDHFHPPVLSAIPNWGWVLLGATLIGIVVNILAVRVVFTPGTPQPRYKCLWKQALLAKRQHSAAADFGHVLAYRVLTIPNVADEVLNGPRGDRTRMMINHVIGQEIDRFLGPFRSTVRLAVGTKEFDTIPQSASAAALGFAPRVLADVEFNRAQAKKIDEFATEKLRALPPHEFMEMVYAAIEQDAWLLYVHGGLLGILVGAAHIAIFGA